MKITYLSILISHTHKAMEGHHIVLGLLIASLGIGFFVFLVYQSTLTNKHQTAMSNFFEDFFKNPFLDKEHNHNKSEFLRGAVVMEKEYGDGRKEYYVRVDSPGLEGDIGYAILQDPENPREGKYFSTREEADLFRHKRCLKREGIARCNETTTTSQSLAETLKKKEEELAIALATIEMLNLKIKQSEQK